MLRLLVCMMPLHCFKGTFVQKLLLLLSFQLLCKILQILAFCGPVSQSHNVSALSTPTMAPKNKFAGELRCEAALPQIFLTWGNVVYAANWEGERLGFIPDDLSCLDATRRTSMRMPSCWTSTTMSDLPRNAFERKTNVTKAWFWHNMALFAR